MQKTRTENLSLEYSRLLEKGILDLEVALIVVTNSSVKITTKLTAQENAILNIYI